MSAAGAPLHLGGRSRLREWWNWARPGLEDLTKVLTAVSIIGTGVRFYAEADDRTRDLLYKEWEEVRGPATQGRNGARDHALADLARRKVSLENLDLQAATMDGISLRGAILNRSRFDHAELKGADFGCQGTRCTQLTHARLPGAVLTGARLEGANMSNAVLEGAVLLNACLRGATLRRAHLSGAVLDSTNLAFADLREADLEGISNTWRTITDMRGSNIWGVENAPPGFVSWARDKMGAVEEYTDSGWQAATRSKSPPPSCQAPQGAK